MTVTGSAVPLLLALPPIVVSPFANVGFGPSHVLGMSYRLEMTRIYAARVLAKVIKFKAGRDWAKQRLVPEDVSTDDVRRYIGGPFADMEHCVTAAVVRSLPRPAAGAPLDLGVPSFKGVNSNRVENL